MHGAQRAHVMCAFGPAGVVKPETQTTGCAHSSGPVLGGMRLGHAWAVEREALDSWLERPSPIADTCQCAYARV